MQDLDDITGAIIEAALRMHRDLGPGLLESVYEAILFLTYLKLTNRQVGLLLNFGAPTLREGLRRIVNGFQPSAFPRLRVNQRLPGNANRQGSTETA